MILKQYTMRDWFNDRTFNAQPGQEVSEEVWYEMLNCLPPRFIPGGFQVGEPTTILNGKQAYSTFRKINGVYTYCGIEN